MIKSANDIYPLTIIASRYSGVYSGGAFLAWNIFHHEIPQSATGSDVDCNEFWCDFVQGQSITNRFNEKVFVGKGQTTGEAIADLIKLMNQ